MIPTEAEAIVALIPDAEFGMSGGKIFWHDSRIQPTDLEIKTKLDELMVGYPMQLLREERNKRIAETDWWASSDLLISNKQREYRKALRDITKTAEPKLDEYGNLTNMVWPEKP
jgi:hypothetical protein